MLDKEMKYLVEGMVIKWLKGFFWQWVGAGMFDCLNGLLRHDHMLNMLCIFRNMMPKRLGVQTVTETSKKKPVNHPFSSLFTRKVCVSPFDAVGRSNVGGGRRELGHGPVNGSSVGFEEIRLTRIRGRPGGWTHGQWEFQDLTMEVRKRTIFLAIFCGAYIALNNRPYIW